MIAFVKKTWKVGLLLPVVVVVAFHAAYWGKVYPGVKVAGVDLSNRSETQVTELLEQKAAQALMQQPGVKLVYEGNEWNILKAGINFKYLPQETARAAVMVGRRGNLAGEMVTKWRAWWTGVAVPFEFELEEDWLEMQAATIAAELTIPAVPPEIEVLAKPSNGSRVRVREGEPGQTVDANKIVDLIKQRLQQADTTPVALPVTQVAVEVTSEQMEQATLIAERLVDKELVFKLDDEEWRVKGETIVGWIDFRDGWDETKIKTHIEGLAKGVDRPAQNAAFQYVEGRVTEFKPARTGIKVNVAISVEEAINQLVQLEVNSEESGKVNLAVTKTEPEVGLDEVNSLGLKELLGKGKSTFRGSIPGRVHNVGLSASRINGVLVKPGDTFSFNQWVGEVSATTGYQQAYVIRSGATVLDDGGGVCQTSTTLFRAVMNAGLPIVERKAHSYRVGYYEQDSKPGFDATVFSPTADFKFINDTPAHILVQTSTAGTSLTVEIYGTSDGRKTEIANYRMWDVVTAPPPRYQDDPSVPSGQTKQVDWAAPGSKVKFDYIVKRGGETIFSKTFYSQYQAWQAVYLRGV